MTFNQAPVNEQPKLKKQRPQPLYMGGLEYPEYDHQEYPKWVGNVIVQDATEEKKVVAEQAREAAEKAKVEKEAAKKAQEAAEIQAQVAKDAAKQATKDATQATREANKLEKEAK